MKVSRVIFGPVVLFYVVLMNEITAQELLGRAFFEKSNTLEKVTTAELIKSSDSWSLYKMSHVLDSYNQMYIATGDKYYIREALVLIKNVIKNSKTSALLQRSQFKDSYKGWENKSHEEKGNDGKEYPLFESYFWRYVTSTLVIIHENFLLHEYFDDYNLIFRFTEKNIFEKWYVRGKPNIYRENINMSALWAHISLNMWLITQSNIYKDVVLDFNTKFLNNLIVQKKTNTVFWNSFFDRKKWNLKGQDVLHANAEVSYVIDAYQKGGYFNYSLITQLINTLQTTIIRTDGTTAMYLDGSGNSKGRIVDGFMKLGRFDRNLQKRLKTLSFISPSEYHKKNQFIAVLMANDKLLNF